MDRGYSLFMILKDTIRYPSSRACHATSEPILPTINRTQPMS